MKASIQDTGALAGVSPAALSAYARSFGWVRTEDYGDHSDVYSGEGLPEVVLPRTRLLGDYASVVSRLIEVFSGAIQTDTLAIYRDLLTADRDVIRVRAPSNPCLHRLVAIIRRCSPHCAAQATPARRRIHPER